MIKSSRKKVFIGFVFWFHFLVFCVPFMSAAAEPSLPVLAEKTLCNQLKKKGCKIYLNEHGKVTQVTLVGDQITRGNIDSLNQFPELTSLFLSEGTNLFDTSDFENLGRLKKLRILMFYKVAFKKKANTKAIKAFAKTTNIYTLRIAVKPIPEYLLRELHHCTTVKNLCLQLDSKTEKVDCKVLPKDLISLRLFHPKDSQLTFLNLARMHQLKHLDIIPLAPLAIDPPAPFSVDQPFLPDLIAESVSYNSKTQQLDINSITRSSSDMKVEELFNHTLIYSTKREDFSDFLKFVNLRMKAATPRIDGVFETESDRLIPFQVDCILVILNENGVITSSRKVAVSKVFLMDRDEETKKENPRKNQ